MLGDSKLALGTFGSSYAVYDWQTDQWDVDSIEVGNGVNAITVHQGDTYTVGDAGIVRKNGKPFSLLGSLCNFLLPVGDRFFAAGQLGQLYDVASGQIIFEHHSPLNCAVFFNQGNQSSIAIGSYTGEILIFSILPDQTLHFVNEIKVYENAVKGLAANQNLLFSVCASTQAALHNCLDLSLVAKINKAHDKIANACCTIGKSGFASVGRDRTLRIWIDGKSEVYESPHLHSIKCICSSPDDDLVLTGSYGGTVAGFDYKTRSWTLFERPTMAGISSISYDPMQSHFLAASYDGNVYPVTPKDIVYEEYSRFSSKSA
jgi:WD40 repeat protein